MLIDFRVGYNRKENSKQASANKNKLSFHTSSLDETVIVSNEVLIKLVDCDKQKNAICDIRNDLDIKKGSHAALFWC